MKWSNDELVLLMHTALEKSVELHGKHSFHSGGKTGRDVAWEAVAGKLSVVKLANYSYIM
jgi:diacylglycerol kinase